ncbi:Cysteine protease atg4 [Apophysomyces sp. BC1015]|nr:Cysteine protease atg4 [Apophysomyces sp. BC1015]
MNTSQPAASIETLEQKLSSEDSQTAQGLSWPKGKGTTTTMTTTTATPKASVSASDLPQPQNSNHISTAPFKDKLITNSSYLAAEIPLKLGHFVSHMWTSGSELSSSFFLQRAEENKDRSLWLLGQHYEMPDNQLKMQNDMLDAQKDDMFTTNDVNESTPTDDESAKRPMFAMSLLWPPDFYEDFTSRVWMTYRHNYPPIRPSTHKTDIGWGCMLRSGQSLLANALVIHFIGRGWRRSEAEDTSRKEYCKIVHWFLDELSPRAPFSIHRIALLGKQLGKNIGEWFGPSTISQVIQALVSDYPPAKMAVYIATDGVVYRNDVHDVATGKKPRGDFGSLSSRMQNMKEDDRDEAREIYHHYSTAAHDTENNDIRFKSVLGFLKTLFRGRPNSSLYFIGLQGDELIYLDPHFSRPALETKNLVDYTEAEFGTYHCTIPRRIHISNLDPSMLLGFYCRTEEEFDIFCEQIQEIAKRYTPIFTIEKQAPEYDEDMRSENDFGVVSEEEDNSGDIEDDLQ